MRMRKGMTIKITIKITRTMTMIITMTMAMTMTMTITMGCVSVCQLHYSQPWSLVHNTKQNDQNLLFELIFFLSRYRITLIICIFFLISLEVQTCSILFHHVFLGQNIAIISSNMQHHEVSQMSPWLLGSLIMLYLVSYFQNAAS